MKKAFESELTALLEKYGFEAKIELTEKKRSLKLADIVKKQVGKTAYFPTQFGLIFSDSVSLSSYHIEQIKESSARKSMLYGQIQRIADYANGDWVADWDDISQTKNFVSTHKNKVRFGSCCEFNDGFPVFKSTELRDQAYEDNKDIFDEFFSL